MQPSPHGPNGTPIPGVSEDMPTIIASKLVPPACAASHLARSHLVAAMLAAHSARLLLIRAPAGFGKTTLMQQYAAACQAKGDAIAWVRLDAADNDLPRFLGHLAAGLQVLHPSRQTLPASAERMGAGVIATVAAVSQPFAILLDDFEVIQSEAVLNFVQLLLESLPPNGTLVVASRTTPSLGLGRVRARGHLLELQPGALRFTLPEAAAFIREKCGITLSDVDVARLHRCTEGWATAIYLATLSLRQHPDHSRFVASFSGTNTDLAEYLAQDILGRQSEPVRRFLLETSVLSHLSAPLCDAILDRNDSHAMLAALEHDNLFLFPLNGEQDEYRYHSLFASFLQHRLRSLNPERETALHAAAARWYLQARRPIPAIDHLLRAGLLEAATAEMALHADTLLNNGRVRLLSRWFDLVRDRLSEADPRVRITAAWVLLLNRRFAEALQAVQCIVDDTRTSAAHESVQRQAETLRCVLFAMTDRTEACREIGLPLLQHVPPDDSFQYWLLANSVAYGLVSVRRHDEARQVLANACAGGRHQQMPLLRSVADCLESIIDLFHGRLGRSMARLRGAQQTWHDRTDEVTGGRAAAGVILALLCYEADQIDEAARLVNDTLPFAKMTGPVDSMITCHILSARIALARGDRDLWQRRLLELEELGGRVPSERAICSTWLERTRVATLDGALDAAAQALHAAGQHGAWETLDDAGYANEVDVPAVARWRLQIARGADASLCDALAHAVATAAAQQRHWRLLKLRLLHAMALESAGEHEHAFDALTEALRIASHEGLRRSFIDEGAPLVALLQRWNAAHRMQGTMPGVAAGFVPDLLARMGVSDAEPAEATAAPDISTPTRDMGLDALTTRELDVLHMLSHGHRNRAIAEKLFVSELTVKSHLRRISAKLGAQSRTEVVAIARQRGLLD
ncbi:LuxR C-terminal-related transcriptional regulator [Cupriavidus sp. 2SB]|uniref:helix-turn-helix transcriptional regulator n=1 Tax=unclassified Cupriavidus TaxID=2640874 RepID=UPI0010F9F1D1|nr:LuxR C-terminal-related transcriptional regulator [Cupriavidus sp. 2SB]